MYLNNCSNMKFFLYNVFVMLLIVTSVHCKEANLTSWHHLRREKRFLTFANSGTCKFVGGITMPVNLSDKRFWRQLVLTMNLQYQFPLPTQPIYWWDAFDDRAMGRKANRDHVEEHTVDNAQAFLYSFVEELMNQRRAHGRDCLLRAICDNAQIHHHHGLFAEIFHRILIPHKSLEKYYVDAYHMGRHGVDCLAAFPHGKHCPFDQFLHVREDYDQQTFVK